MFCFFYSPSNIVLLFRDMDLVSKLNAYKITSAQPICKEQIGKTYVSTFVEVVRAVEAKKNQKTCCRDWTARMVMANFVLAFGHPHYETS